MKIAFLTTEYPHPRIPNAAGIGTSIRNLAEALVAEGHEPVILVVNQDQPDVFRENGITFHLIPRKKFGFLQFYRYRKYLQHYINQHAASEKWDVLEAPDWTASTAFMTLRIPIVVRLHGSDSYFCKLENRPQKKKHFWLEQVALRGADAIISPSAFTADVSAGIFGLRRDKIHVIHYGLSLDRFQNPAPNDFERGLILCSGTIIRKKGALELPEIFRKVHDSYPGARLLLLGGDAADIATGSPSTWALVQKALGPELQPLVAWPGRVPYEEMQSYIRKAHLCIFPTYAETLGMVTIEAMAMQKPVVNSNIGWANEIITHGESGLMSHPSDHQAFADNILSILRDDHLRERLSAGALRRVQERFDIRRNVHQNIAVYQQLLRK